MSTFTKIYIHIVFRVKYLQHQLNEEKRTHVYKYINGIISNLEHKPLCINGMGDHIHILIGLKPDKNISDLVKEIKRCSTNFINENKFIRGKFAWQEGFGAFSYSYSEKYKIINYIKNQEAHHKKKSYREEYLQLLKDYDIHFDEQWID